MTRLADLVETAQLREDVTLGPLTTYKLGGPARWYAEPHDEDELREVVAAVRADPAGGDAPVLVLGRGSNLAVADAGFPGLVVRLGSGFAGIDIAPDGTVTAGGAAPLPVLARTTVAAGRGGLEFFVGIPGSVGAAVRMNAGCLGSETVDWLIAARVLDLFGGTVAWRPAGDLGLAYRHSDLGDGDVVVGARFRTEPSTPEAGSAVLREVTRWRRDHQPGGTLNAGSVFKNPPGDHAGRLIDAAGLKGLRVGGVAVSAKHANFFVADRSASAQDVYDLVWTVRRRVQAATGVLLEPEIRFAGLFRPHPDAPAGERAT